MSVNPNNLSMVSQCNFIISRSGEIGNFSKIVSDFKVRGLKETLVEALACESDTLVFN